MSRAGRRRMFWDEFVTGVGRTKSFMRSLASQNYGNADLKSRLWLFVLSRPWVSGSIAEITQFLLVIFDAPDLSFHEHGPRKIPRFDWFWKNVSGLWCCILPSISDPGHYGSHWGRNCSCWRSSRCSAGISAWFCLYSAGANIIFTENQPAKAIDSKKRFIPKLRFFKNRPIVQIHWKNMLEVY